MANFNQTISNFVNHNTSCYPRGMRRNTSAIDEASFVKAMKNAFDYNNKQTENGANARKSTNVKLYDLFALGGSYRSRTESDCVLLFKEAYQENPTYALKCLWYLRDINEGQGERRFFRVCLKWLANNYPEVVKRNLKTIPEFGRWDDLYSLVDTPCEKFAFDLMKQAVQEDLEKNGFK